MEPAKAGIWSSRELWLVHTAQQERLLCCALQQEEDTRQRCKSAADGDSHQLGIVAVHAGLHAGVLLVYITSTASELQAASLP